MTNSKVLSWFSIATLFSATSTITVQLAVFPFNVAVIIAVPGAIAVTSPFSSTVAILSSPDDQFTSSIDGSASSGFLLTVNCTVSLFPLLACPYTLYPTKYIFPSVVENSDVYIEPVIYFIFSISSDSSTFVSISLFV